MKKNESVPNLDFQERHIHKGCFRYPQRPPSHAIGLPSSLTYPQKFNAVKQYCTKAYPGKSRLSERQIELPLTFQSNFRYFYATASLVLIFLR